VTAENGGLTSTAAGEYILAHVVLFFSKSLVRAQLFHKDEREAGENPALPRNCKRGNAASHWKKFWEGWRCKPDALPS